MVGIVAETRRECPIWYLKPKLNPTTRTSPNTPTNPTYLPARRRVMDHPVRQGICPLGHQSHQNHLEDVRSGE